MDDNRRHYLIMRLAAGTDASPKTIRSAAVRLMTGYSDEEDEQLVNEYLESMYDD
jgi:hypothetical protein